MFKGTPCHTYGNLPAVGSQAPDFTLTTSDLGEVAIGSFVDKKIVLNIFPSLDTPVCATSVRRFNKEATDLNNAVVVCVSMDLPFAAARFCTTENIKNLIVTSAFRSPGFVKNYGVQMVDGPLAGLLARAIVIIDEEGKVIYRELVHELTDEPDYKAALSVIRHAK